MSDITWEEEKAAKLKELASLEAACNEGAEYLKQFGIRGDTLHGKLNAVIEMLLETGVITEQQLLDMELKFARDTYREIKDACEEMNKQVQAAQRQQLITPKSQGLIVPRR